MMSFICLLSRDAREEIDNKLQSRNFYVDANNEMAFSAAGDIIELVFATLSD
jgi:hypothetical protein